MHQWASLAAAAALLANGAVAQFNMLRFACSQLVVDRVDPLVNPGLRYTPHLHQIVGGNSFNLTMTPVEYDLAKRSTCTSCSFNQDKSNYWTAVMFFKAKNGTYHRVPQVGNGGPQGKLVNNGGLDVYYIPSGKTTAFKPGFRMLAGNAANTDDSKVSKGNICHRCWTSTSDTPFVGGAPCTGSDTVAIPQETRCKMIRQTIIFPTCWDGKNLDTPDHKSHVAYGQGSGASGGGACPSSHPVKLPQVMYELMWDVSKFADKSIWPDSGPAFMYSMNLGGSAAHGDYVFGWEGDTLQRAMDSGCNLNNNCPAAGLTAQTPEQYNACTIKQQAPEDVDGWLKAMPMGEMALRA
ncbi:hypothetical protein CHGG_08309 [Chaetomium globosum CBS 148.51]|uniref:DUF1996 domain-containing protein n=1 Tax=Chaetomium globosum (strain ATCC 6205 / CBS 148.51 / DSM 1962 / NBRC 6347 / NRRL 1970) TaxID=306901 RepID=Q2GUP5_CHAGB|nr:uncharacterized protein CHGG_08309 [Chaetomium globosum CBS 148.51]EAQ87056.1 hypothetical protein CHGG_08309 [Chaetomium globosum CBS 148.51]